MHLKSMSIQYHKGSVKRISFKRIPFNWTLQKVLSESFTRNY